MADVKTEYFPADGEKKAYAEIRVEGLTEEQSLALRIVLHEGGLRERERIVNVLKEAKEDYSDVIKLIEMEEVGKNDA
jgi:hypothetical protein